MNLLSRATSLTRLITGLLLGLGATSASVAGEPVNVGFFPRVGDTQSSGQS